MVQFDLRACCAGHTTYRDQTYLSHETPRQNAILNSTYSQYRMEDFLHRAQRRL